jgi:pyruvate-ferredoxin/flavodoxin oxidoreductase
VNVLVVDTEVYSNTGGQSSKATNRSAVAQFAADAYSKAKKDLGQIAMTYGNIYVASTCLLANAAHALKAIQEAGEYNGPSLVVNYAPCINHGIAGGLTATSKNQFKKYFNLFQVNPPKKHDSSAPKPAPTGGLKVNKKVFYFFA